MGMHIGREWTTHNIEDNCPCPKLACGLVDQDNTSPDCEQHPMGRGKTLRQGHTIENCPATPRAVALAIGEAYEAFFCELDTIAGKYGQSSDVFMDAVTNECGEQPAYDDWMQESWEWPVPGEII